MLSDQHLDGVSFSLRPQSRMRLYVIIRTTRRRSANQSHRQADVRYTERHRSHYRRVICHSSFRARAHSDTAAEHCTRSLCMQVTLARLYTAQPASSLSLSPSECESFGAWDAADHELVALVQPLAFGAGLQPVLGALIRGTKEGDRAGPCVRQLVPITLPSPATNGDAMAVMGLSRPVTSRRCGRIIVE
jgi:hypothetical protein